MTAHRRDLTPGAAAAASAPHALVLDDRGLTALPADLARMTMLERLTARGNPRATRAGAARPRTDDSATAF